MKITATRLEAYQLFHDGILALAKAESHGIRIDVDYCLAKKEHLTRRIEREYSKLEKTDFIKTWKKKYRTKFNLDSTTQLSDILYNVMGINPPKTTDKGTNSADEDALSKIDIPELKSILKIRKIQKIRDTYLEGFLREQVDGWIHPFFNLHTVITYRSSCDSPNFQNIPKRDKEAMKICRDALYPRKGFMILEVDYSGLEVSISACVTKDTLIETAEGSIQIGDVIQLLKQNKMIYVYSFDTDKGKLVLSKVTEGGMTKRKTEIWEVKLDNNKTIKATPDHKFMMRDGSYKQLKDLNSGDSLMPFYKKNKKSNYGTVYRKVYLNNGKWENEHNIIAEYIYGKKISGSPFIVHHKDGNGCNNNPKNLLICTRKEHMRIHSIQGWKKVPKEKRHFWQQTPEGIKAVKEMNKRRNEEWTESDWEEFGKRISDSIKSRGGYSGKNNPMYGKTQSQLTRKKISIAKIGIKRKTPVWNTGKTKYNDSRLKRLSDNKKGKPAWNKGKRGLYQTSEKTKELISIKMKGRIFTSQTRKKLSDNKKEYWNSRKQRKKVVCPICKKEFVSITNTHLKRKHNISLEEFKETYNHTVISIKKVGYEDVFNINVEKTHNYATSAGVIIKNCYHKDPTMISYLKDSSSDMHGDMAKQIFMVDNFDKKKNPEHKYLRNATKNSFVFPQFYGDYYANNAKGFIGDWLHLPEGQWKENQGCPMPNGVRISDHMILKGIKNYIAFENHMKKIEKDFWEKRFPVYKKWKIDTFEKYQKDGYVDMFTGFRCSGIMRKNEVVNYPVQGAASHCLLWAFIQLDKIFREKGLRSRLIGQIHDAMILDVHPDELEEVGYLIKKVTCRDLPKVWTWISVPLDVEADLCGIDKPWSEKQSYKLKE